MDNFRFEKFVEDWCMIYKPMQHVPGEKSRNKRFFFTDSYMGLADFMASFSNKTSPCVVMESGQDGSIIRGLDQPRHTLYFLVRAEDSQDGFAARAASAEAKTHMLKFVAYLRDKAKRQDELRRIDIEQLSYQTVGPLYNSWYAVYITMEDTKQIQLCISADDYVD